MNTNKELAIIRKATVPICLHPKLDSVMADEGLLGMIVKILKGVKDGWYYIETHYNYKGYVHKDNLIIDEKKTIEWKNNAHNVVTHSFADVMSQPSYQSYIIDTLVKGNVIRLTNKEKDGWVQVQLPDYRKGWVRSAFVGELITTIDKSKEDILRKNLVETALSYLGTQYRWGGKSPLGIDCSGLCSISYLLNGIIIYRDAILKDEYMQKISIEEVKPADLIFFPGHVAMYIGNDKFVHSSSSISGVGINSLNPSHSDYRDDLARKIIGVGTVFNSLLE